jgi:hypothetical protein
MLVPHHLVDIYQEMLSTLDAELIIEDDKVAIDSMDGRIIIYEDGFIDHMDFHGGPYEEQLINFALVLVNKIAPYKRISEGEYYAF